MPFDDAPYGVFEFLHRWGLRGASLETAPVWGWIELMVLPLIPLYIQAYLLVGTGQSSTRVLRAALALITVALMARGWTSWRFTSELG
jgi:hypothetical protein